MYVSRDLHPEFKVMNERCVELAPKIVAGLKSAEVEIPAGADPFGAPENKGKLYRLKEGVLALSRHGRVVWFYEPGDLFGADVNFWSWDTKVAAEFAVRCEEFSLAEVLQAAGSSPERLAAWTEYLALFSSMAQSLATALLHDEIETQPKVKAFRAGDTIIEQGSAADEVYTLVDGHAEVLVDGVKVGEVLRDELFGVLAALGGTKRTASVVATQTCLVLALPCEDFSQLMQSRPRLIVKLVEDIARAMAAANSRLVGRF